MANPISAFDRVREEVFRYYGTPYRLNDKAVEQERLSMLDREGMTWREPWVEPILEYNVTGQGVQMALAGAGAPEELADFARQGLLDPRFPDIYKHQRDAVRSVVEGRNVVITAGTGSGKTEAFLLPLAASLLAESRSWTGTSPIGTLWWEGGGSSFVPQRLAETGRDPGIRALLLYPMNPLVEDQVTRLRKAFDSPTARQWLDEHRSGHRFYFGRYTGATPTAGSQANNAKRRYLAKLLRESTARFERWQVDREKRYFLASPDGAEMRSRWDMQAHPPDILVTNYSMLNIMLMRDIENPIFEKTRSWLAADPSHVFHLIVDELHMYRGTQGSEVAYLIRNLLYRLGLSPDSPQVRFIATSASFSGKTSSAQLFLSEFFGADPDSFDEHSGELVRYPNAPFNLLPQIESLSNLEEQDAGEFLTSIQAKATIVEAALDTAPLGGSTLPISALDNRLFPGCGGLPATPSKPMRQLMEAIEIAGLQDQGLDLPRLRAHFFFRNVQGVWACTDPDCKQIESSYQAAARVIGKLFPRPRHRCDCGARVLRLLYCQACGELYFEGFLGPAIEHTSRFPAEDRFLVGELGDLEAIPDQARVVENSLNSSLYWPRPVERRFLPREWNRTHDGHQYNFKFYPARFDPLTGRLKQVRNDQRTGWTFEVRTSASDDKRESIPALPTQCPQCHADWEMFTSGPRARPITDRSRMRSPIRRMGTGYEKIGQIIVDALVRELRNDSTPIDEQRRRLVLFSDSRQDAAKLSAGLEKRHYQDLVRELIVGQLDVRTSDDLELVKLFFAGNQESQVIDARRRLRIEHRDLHDALDDAARGDSIAAAKAEELTRQYLSGTSVAELKTKVELGLLRLGINPAGPDPSNSKWRTRSEGTVHWHELYSWSDEHVTPRSPLEGTNEQTLRRRIDDALLRECQLNVFSGNGRDLESLGLARPNIRISSDTSPPAGIASEVFEEAIRGCVRILGDSRRQQGVRWGRPDPPAHLRDYMARVAELHDVETDVLREAINLAWQDGVREHLLLPQQLVLHPASPEMWICQRCSRRHLDRAAGICTTCLSLLPLTSTSVPRETDYYAHRAKQNDPFRLHSEELTGQTDRDDGPRRQAYFQDIFLDNERSEVTGIDLLSVTTTMEAGVDIGALRGVVMSNMPPQRFNYQQRAGRTGRRRDPYSFALTLCRDRTHDEYYFDNPQRITNEPPPEPYLDLGRPEIIRRVASAEALRRAFEVVGQDRLDFDPGDNTHGQFGSVDTWPQVRDNIDSTLQTLRTDIESFVQQLLLRAPIATSHQLDGIVDFVSDGALVAEINHAIENHPRTQPDLSQHLAERGLLPMFGFPTRIRNLYLRRPYKGYEWPPANAISRQLDIAVLEFAPGAETVKDKELHTAIGIAGYEPAGSIVRPTQDPLSPSAHPISLCQRCRTIRPLSGDTARATCGICGAPTPEYCETQLSEPAGFRTDYRPSDFEGSFTRSARGTSPRITPDLSLMRRAECLGVLAFAGPGDIYVVNDNAGRQYRFVPAADGDEEDSGTWISADHLDSLTKSISVDRGQEWVGAIGVVKSTDALLLGLRRAHPALNLAPFHPAIRAAWYSLGFLLRSAASRLLDIGTSELQVGYSVRQLGTEDSRRQQTEVFLADSLDNGAGYSTWLGLAENLDNLMQEAANLIVKLSESNHACDSSCPDCLRDYTNIIFHPLLDWRLARDLTLLHLDHEFDPAPWNTWEERTADAFAEAFTGRRISLDGNVQGVQVGDRLLLVHHPLENATTSDAIPLTTRLEHAIVDAESMVNDPAKLIFASSFDLDRRPGFVAAHFGISA